MFVDLDPIGSYEAFNETLTVVKNNFRAIFLKKNEFLRLFLRELQEVKLGGQQRSNRDQSTHNWKK